MVRNTRHVQKHRKKAYRYKTQKGGAVSQLVSSISNAISHRIGPLFIDLLHRAQASGSAPLATHAIAQTGTLAAEGLSTALQSVVSEAVASNPELARSSALITNEILTSAATRLAASANATAGITTGASAAALATAAAGALSTSASATGAVLFSLLQTATSSPETMRQLIDVLRRQVLPSVQKGIRRVISQGAASAVREAAAPALVMRNPALLSGPGFPLRTPGVPARGQFARVMVQQGTQPRRGFASVAANSAAAARARERVAEAANANGPAAIEETPANAAPAPGARSTKGVLTDEQIDQLTRVQLKRYWEEYTPPGTVGRPARVAPSGAAGTKQMRKNMKDVIMPEYRQEYARIVGKEYPPPVKNAGVIARPEVADLIKLRAKEIVVAEGGSPAQATKIDKAVETSKQQTANAFDLLFKPSPQFQGMITSPEVMAAVIADTPIVANNAASLTNALLRDSALGKSVKAFQFSERNVNYYRIFGGNKIDAIYVESYNRNVESALRLLLERASKSEIENLMATITEPQMQAFRIAFFDYFLSSPPDAMRVMQTIVVQILPYNRLTPVAFDSIITALQHNPEGIAAVLERIVGQRAVAEQEVSYAIRLWRSRGAGQTTGRYGIMALGVSAILFLATWYDFSNPNELMWLLRNELAGFGFNDIIVNGINSMDRFYDAVHYAIVGRNAEQAISDGIINPVAAVASAAAGRWDQFIQAGRPLSIFETIVNNLNTILDRVGRDNAMIFAGGAVVSILIYQARQQAATRNAALAPPNAALAPPNPNDLPPLLPNTAALASPNVAANPRRNLASLPALPANGNNW
jgi:hypothetical protein